MWEGAGRRGGRGGRRKALSKQCDKKAGRNKLHVKQYIGQVINNRALVKREKTIIVRSSLHDVVVLRSFPGYEPGTAAGLLFTVNPLNYPKVLECF